MRSSHNIICVFIIFCVNNILCRIPELDGRIVGGIAANIQNFPYQISLRFYGAHVCGGSVIQQSYILTAAHCVHGYKAREFSITAGSHFLDSGGIETDVCSMIIHSRYDDVEEDYDIAVLKLCKPLPFGRAILPIALVDDNEDVAVGTPAVVSGWGYNKESGKIQKSLQQVTVPIVDQQKCKNFYVDEGSITSRMLCAGFTAGRRDSCQGDSGGPLVANGKLVGIVSWGYGCARPKYPGVYTRMSKFRTWIKNKINY